MSQNDKTAQPALSIPALSGEKEIAPAVRPIFIADLHLTGKKPMTLLSFFWFLRTTAKRYAELFILGDFFEYWIGDDGAEPARPIVKALRRYAAAGHKVYIMQGNRDFLIGPEFCASCSATLLAPQVALTVEGEFGQKRILLAHGDEWCLNDPEYQEFRAQMRDPEFQRMAYSMTVADRIAYAKNARAKSKENKTVRTQAMMDVVSEAIARDAEALDCTAVIHGHTHRPAAYPNEAVPRFVIPDWEIDKVVRRRRGWIEINSQGNPQIVIG